MIFVNIAAYNDKQIYDTIISLLRKSAHFANLSIGICWQSNLKLNINLPNVRIIHLPLNNARGVGYARSVAHNLFDGADYYLTIDSHMKFPQSWDTRIIQSYRRLQSIYGQKILFSSYCPGWNAYPFGKATKTIPQAEFNQYGVLRFRAGQLIQNDLLYPPIACHFMFAESSFFEELPHDPDIFYNGEEIAYTVRAFTHGWSNIQPATVYCYHKYRDKTDTNVVWKQNKEWWKLNNPSLIRVKSICSHLDDRLGCYGKGTVRPLQELEKILRVDFTKRLVWT